MKSMSYWEIYSINNVLWASSQLKVNCRTKADRPQYPFDIYISSSISVHWRKCSRGEKGNPVHAHSRAPHPGNINVSVCTLVCMFECKWVWEYASVILKENVIVASPAGCGHFMAHQTLSMNNRCTSRH